jgi:hypothetical protein
MGGNSQMASKDNKKGAVPQGRAPFLLLTLMPSVFELK